MATPDRNTDFAYQAGLALSENRTSLGKNSLAKAFVDADDKTWVKVISKASQERRQDKNRIRAAGVLAQTEYIAPGDPADDTRVHAEQTLLEAKKFSDNGIEATSTSTDITDKIAGRIKKQREISQEAIKGKEETINDQMVNDERFLRIVQERAHELETRTDFVEPYRKLTEAESAYQDAQQAQKDAVQEIEGLGKDIETLKEKLTHYTDATHGEAQRLKAIEEEITKKESNPKTNDALFEQEYARYTRLVDERDKLLKQKTYDAVSIKSVDDRIDEIIGDYPERFERKLLQDEQSQIQKDIDDLQDQKTKLEDSQGGLAEDVTKKDEVRDRRQREYDQVVEDYMADVDSLYEYATDQWISEKMQSYRPAYEPAKNKFVSEEEARQNKELYDDVWKSVQERYMMTQRLGPNGRILWQKHNLGAIMHDYRTFCDQGYDGLMAEFTKGTKLAITDAEKQQIEKYMVSTIITMREEIIGAHANWRMTIQAPRRFQTEAVRHHCRNMLDVISTTDEVAKESLKAYDQGDRGNVDWYIALQNSISLADSLIKDAEEEDKKAA